MEKEEKIEEDSSVLRSFSGVKTPLFSGMFVVVLFAVVLLGVGAGYLLTKTNKTSMNGSTASTSSNGSGVSKGAVEGSEDLKTFKDPAEGVLKKGGIEDEGQYHLVRPGGESQNVYMTSSIVDLSKYIDRKVKVWGETQTAQKAGWLMDVGRVEVLE